MGTIILGTHIIILNKNGEVLLGKRQKKLAFGHWELPGGHVEFKEELKDTLTRECKEELGIDAVVGDLISVCTHAFYGEHVVVFTFTADSYKGIPKMMEEGAHESWQWFDLNKLPEKLLITTEFALDDYKNGKIYQKRSPTITKLTYL